MKMIIFPIILLCSISSYAQSVDDLVSWFNKPVINEDLELLLGEVPEEITIGMK